MSLARDDWEVQLPNYCSSWSWLAIQKTQMRKAWKNCTGGRAIDGEGLPLPAPTLAQIPFRAVLAPLRSVLMSFAP